MQLPPCSSVAENHVVVHPFGALTISSAKPLACRMNTLQPAAPQAYATRILLPAALAWCTQLCLGSVATARAVDLLLSRKKQSSVPYARVMLALATLSNVAAVLISAWSLIDFVVVQDREWLNISYARIARAYAPLPIGFTA